MIRYALRCAQGHDFDGWFRSAADFDRLSAAGQISCSICGGGDVAKAPMAPAVPARNGARPLAEVTPQEQALSGLRRRIEAHSDYVGADFATQARAMHDGELPSRSIHGEARLDEARKLIEDGVPIAPLPFRPRRKLS